mmetsp:Transcript_84829/g.262614  ORF Transcript_84829/g.262614 Transcript_84829/m.262614 type:complete len:319 (-) Transcript_84829:497-1453(-)
MVARHPGIAGREGVRVAPLEAALASEAALIGVQDSAKGLVPLGPDPVVCVRAGRMEVEDDQALSALHGDHLVLLAHERAVVVPVAQEREAALDLHHVLVELVEEPVAQVVLVRQVVATVGVVVAPAVALAREVDPLGVAELVAAEAQVALPQRKADHADHLVQGQAALDAGRRGRQRAHARVHLGVHEPERDRLVADDGLVVGLCVGNASLILAAVLQLAGDPLHAPGLVARALLQDLDPHVGDGHGQPGVEPKAALLDGERDGGHAADVLGYGGRRRQRGLDDVVREHEVDVRRDVSVGSEVIVTGLADRVRVVQHG